MIAEPLACAATLNRLSFVRWDRFTEDEGEIYAYGWIDRAEDGRSDFALLRLGRDGSPLWFTTSSSERSEEIAARLFGPVAAAHIPCQRIEEALPAVRNAVRL